MEIGARLRRRWYLVILAAIISVAVAGAQLVTFGPHGPHETRHIYHVASGALLVDTNPSTLTNITSSSAALGGRAVLIAEYGTDPSVVAKIAALSGIPVSQLQVEAETTSPTKSGGVSSKGVVAGAGPNSVLLRSTGQGQTIDISAQSHTGHVAKALVAAAITALRGSLLHLQDSQPLNRVTTSDSSSTTTTSTSAGSTKKGAGTGSSNSAAAAQAAASAAAAKQARSVALTKIVLRRLGAVTVTKVISTPKKSKAIGYAVGAFIVFLLLILVLDNLLRGSTKPRTVVTRPATGPED